MLLGDGYIIAGDCDGGLEGWGRGGEGEVRGGAAAEEVEEDGGRAHGAAGVG